MSFAISGHHYDPLPIALGMGKTLGLVWKSNQDLIDQMRLLPWEKVRDSQRKFIQLPAPRAGLPFDFVPCTEPPDSPEPMFMSQSPEEVLRTGNFSLVPIMIGTNSVRSRKKGFESFTENNILG
jgi:hypothetical protein